MRFNYINDEIVTSPSIIVSGSTLVSRGVVTFTNNKNQIFPPLSFEVNNGNFKAIVHLSEGENNFEVEVFENGFINPMGFVEYQGKPSMVECDKLSLKYNEMKQNKPFHLCLIVAKDSPGLFDMPKYKLQRGDHPSIELAVRKLKVIGRLYQAITHDSMRNVGFSNRCFRFSEETQSHQGIFGYNVESPTPHQEIKVHIIQSDKTVAELRDPNRAQQNSNASDQNFTLSHAHDLVRNYPPIFDEQRENGWAVQVACMYLDSTWDRRQNLILAHAAVSSGAHDLKVAVFGSHGLHSFPNNFPQITPCFLDSTHLSIDEVANDCNECGTAWECLNICGGAFLHEIGHALSCPHQVDGIMLRDYVRWNRAFMTRENECIRTKSRGKIIGSNGVWDESCKWNNLDCIRFLFHDAFTLPIDDFGKVVGTTRSIEEYPPTEYPLKNGIAVKSSLGIFNVELVRDGLSRFNIPFFPARYGGRGLVHDIKLDYDQLYHDLKRHTNNGDEKFDVRVMSLGGDLYIEDFKRHVDQFEKNIIVGDFGLGRGKINGYKSTLLGNANNRYHETYFNIHTVYKVRIYHGGSLDGITFYFKAGNYTNFSTPPPILPPRNYMDNLVSKLKGRSGNNSRQQEQLQQIIQNSNSGELQESTIGNKTRNYTDFDLGDGEIITKFHFRNGGWIDAAQIETNTGRKSDMLGNSTGGHLSTLETPNKDFTIVGMFGYLGNWLDGIGIIYA